MDTAGQTRDKAMTMAAITVLGVAVALRWLAFSPYEIGYSDEFMQYLEQATRLTTGHGIVPWEYRYGARNALIPQVMAPAVWLGQTLAPGTHLALYLARAWFAVLASTGALWGAWRLGRLTSPRHGLIALFAAAVWWESVLFSDLMLSESIGASLLLAGAALLTTTTRRGLFWAGLLLGLGVLARLQYGLFAGVLVVMTLRRDGERWAGVIGGGVIALAVGALSDLVMGWVPFRWVLVNLEMNVQAGRAARFGTEPAMYYLRLLLAHWAPGAPLLLAGAVYAAVGAPGRRYRPVLAAALATLAVHSLIAHKEYRFVWVSVLVLVVLAGIGMLRWAERRREAGWPALAAVGAAVWLASWAGAALSGGFGAMRGGAGITTLAVRAAATPGICGIAVANGWRAHVVPSVLGRPVALLVVPAGGGPLPADLARGANALVMAARPAGADGYTPVACKAMPLGQACLFVRPGGCTLAPEWEYQAALLREDL